MAAGRRELDRVRHEIPHHLLQAIGITQDGPLEVGISLEVNPLAAAAGRTASSAASITGASSMGLSSSRSLPVTILDTSRMSAISCSWMCALRSMVSSARFIPAVSSFPIRSRRVQPSMALSGVRSSCDSVARNSSFARLAAEVLPPAGADLPRAACAR